MIKWKIQFHIEEALEQRRHKATEELSDFDNCREDSHLRSFYDSDEQILLQRAFIPTRGGPPVQNSCLCGLAS